MIFEPIQVGNLSLQHRVVLAPMTRLRNTDKGVPTDLVPEYYSQRATPGGLLITEGIIISPNGGLYPRVPGIFNEEQIEGWRKVTKAVHEKGGYIFAQIAHLGRLGSVNFSQDNKAPAGPSAIAIKGINIFVHPYGSAEFETPREVTKEEIKEIIDDFVVAAKNAIDAGFDGVEVHAANGFLIDQFINTSSNKRTDEYGGSIENRGRLVAEVTEAVVSAIGAQRTGIRFSPFSELQDMKDDTPYETWTHIVKGLNPKLAYVHFVEPNDDLTKATPDLVNTLDPFRAAWEGVFIAAGGFTTSRDKIESVAKETGNLIAVGRAFIANPDLVERLKLELPLNKFDKSTFSASGPAGYTDYPFYKEE